MDRLLRPEDLAAYLGIPKQTVYREWRKWDLTAYKVGRGLRFRESEVLAWLERQRVAKS
jgi:excisionase family DNA binding protein